MKLDISRARNLIASNKQVDIDSVVRLGNGQKVIGYTYVDDRRRTVYFDPEIKSLAAALAKALPQQPVISLVNASADGSKLLILAYGDTDPGSFYVYDKAGRHLDEIAPVRVALLGKQLAPVQSITFPAADGVSVPAYLTLPPGSTGRTCPQSSCRTADRAPETNGLSSGSLSSSRRGDTPSFSRISADRPVTATTGW